MYKTGWLYFFLPYTEFSIIFALIFVCLVIVLLNSNTQQIQTNNRKILNFKIKETFKVKSE